MGGRWEASLDPDVVVQVKALFEQDGLLKSDGEPDFTENGHRIFSIEVAKFVVNDPHKIATDSLTARRAFELRFDEAMVHAAGAGQEAIDYVAYRTFQWLGSTPSNQAQRMAVNKGLVQIVTQPIFNGDTGNYEIRKFLTSDPRIIKQYYVAPAAASLKKAFMKTNDRAVQVALAVRPDMEEEIGELLISAVIQGMAQLTPGNAGQRLLNHGSRALNPGNGKPQQ